MQKRCDAIVFVAGGSRGRDFANPEHRLYRLFILLALEISRSDVRNYDGKNPLFYPTFPEKALEKRARSVPDHVSLIWTEGWRVASGLG